MKNSLKNIGLILFDIDGVIRSVENSYRLALKKTVYKFSGWEPSYIDIDSAKNEGIWNNDWDLSLELIKRYIKKKKLNLEIPSKEEIVKCFEGYYFGGDPSKNSNNYHVYLFMCVSLPIDMVRRYKHLLAIVQQDTDKQLTQQFQQYVNVLLMQVFTDQHHLLLWIMT